MGTVIVFIAVLFIIIALFAIVANALATPMGGNENTPVTKPENFDKGAYPTSGIGSFFEKFFS